METRYHHCGQPIEFQEVWHGLASYDEFYDPVAPETAITHCPRCGRYVQEEDLHRTAPNPATMLQAWLTAWADIRHQLRGRMVDQALFDTFETSLQQIIAVTNQLPPNSANG